MTHVGIVTGLAAEARIIEKSRARDERPRLAVAGVGAGRAREAAERLIAEGAELLVSFGLCGGLDPALRPGDLVLAEEIVFGDDRRLRTDAARREALRRRAAQAGLRLTGGALYGSARAIAKADEKRALFETSGARAVDMESPGVALAAEAAGVSFLAVRALADP
ncbi:MAG: purine phosphorylase, partial [Kiloniellaceae bacterium]